MRGKNTLLVDNLIFYYPQSTGDQVDKMRRLRKTQIIHFNKVDMIDTHSTSYIENENRECTFSPTLS